MIAEEGLRLPASYREAIDVLQEAGHFGPDLAERLKDWMGFRNVLVHFYLRIDHGHAYDAIRDDLSALDEFARSMAKLLA